MSEELKRAIVDGLIRDNPITISKSDIDGTPVMRCCLSEILEAIRCLKGREAGKQFDFYAEVIAWNHGCEYMHYGSPSFFIIVRHPRDLRLGIKIDEKKIFGQLNGAQRDLYECFAGLIAKYVIHLLMDMHSDGILEPALQSLDEELMEYDGYMEGGQSAES